MILQRAGDDFRSRSGCGINQNDNGNGSRGGRQRGDEIFLFDARAVIFQRGLEQAFAVGVSAARRDDQGVVRQEGGRHADGAVEQAAGVVAQVDDQPLEIVRLSALAKSSVVCSWN